MLLASQQLTRRDVFGWAERPQIAQPLCPNSRPQETGRSSAGSQAAPLPRLPLSEGQAPPLGWLWLLISTVTGGNSPQTWLCNLHQHAFVQTHTHAAEADCKFVRVTVLITSHCPAYTHL